MKLILDTNCFISFLTNRDEVQSRKMVTLWESISSTEKQIIVLSHTISELNFVLTGIYSFKNEEARQILLDLLKNPGVVYECGYYPELIFDLWPKKIRDYGDAVLASASMKLDAKIATFDKNFLKELKNLKLNVFPL